MDKAHVILRAAAAALGAIWVGACVDDATLPTDPGLEPHTVMSIGGSAPPPPSGLVTVESLQLWPWTGRDLSGTIADPVNLLFKGEVDVVSLRAALLSLDGDRTAFGFPAVPPFDCTWTDAQGELQPTYTNGAGWVANAVQLQCGDYLPLRFHIRFFDAGEWVIGAVHFDLLVPNTPEHRVLSWEVPQLLAATDFARTGLLDPPPTLVQLTAPGGVQVIEKVIYDQIPDALKVAMGLAPGPAPGPSVPVLSDGKATVLTFGTRAPVSAGIVDYAFSVPFDQVIPRPFCSQGPADFVLAQGSVEISVYTEVGSDEALETHNRFRGVLNVTPIDISTGLPSGPSFRTQISQIDNTGAGPAGTHVGSIIARKALPPGEAYLKMHLVTGPNGSAHFTTSEKCD